MSAIPPLDDIPRPRPVASPALAAAARLERIVRWLGPLLILTTAGLLLRWSWLKWPDPWIDFGDQLYIAWQLTEGRTLYSEVAYFSGPLAPYVNALWFHLFGVSLLTLATCNLVLAAILVLLLYRLLLAVSDHLTATVAGLVFVCLFAFAQYVGIGNYNYVCPYGHASTHGLLLSIATLASLAAYLRCARTVYLVATGLGLGLVLLTRMETFTATAAAVLIGLAWTLWSGHSSRSRVLGSLGVLSAAAVTPPLLAFLLLWRALPAAEAFRGTLAALLTTVGTDVAALKFFRDGLGISHPAASILALLVVSVCGALLFVPAAAVAWQLQRRGPQRPALAAVAFCLVTAGLSWALPSRAWLQVARPLPVILLGTALYLAVRVWQTRSAPQECRRQTLRLVLVVFAFVLLGKMILNARIYHYGFTLALPATLVLVALLVHWIPAGLTRRGGYGVLFRCVALAVLVAAGAAHLRLTAARFAEKTVTVGRGADTFLANQRGTALNDALALVTRHVAPDQTFAAVPGGAILNYLSRRPNSTPYMTLVPTEFAVYGEQQIVAAYEKHPPDYILLVHRDTSEFGFRFFGTDYGQQLGAWIRRNYRMVEMRGAPPLRDERYGILLLRRSASLPAK